MNGARPGNIPSQQVIPNSNSIPALNYQQAGPSRPYPSYPARPPQYSNQQVRPNNRPDSSHSTASVPSLSHGPSPLPEEVGEVESGVVLGQVGYGVVQGPPGTVPYLGMEVDSPKDPEFESEVDEGWSNEEGRNGQ